MLQEIFAQPLDVWLELWLDNDMSTKQDPAKDMTRTKHSHWCRSAHKTEVRNNAPTAQCEHEAGAMKCSTDTLTVRSVRRQKNRPGEVKVTWSNGGMTWETDPR